MIPPTTAKRVVVIGAGASGLVAARRLDQSGHQVVVLDKGRGVGGRLATRRIGPEPVGVFDHGAQFFTARSPEMTALVDEWIGKGVVHEWCRGFSEDDGHPRYVAVGGMAALAKHLAANLDVRTSTLVFAVEPGTVAPWSIVIDDGSRIDADAVVVTCPLPQSYALLVTAGVEIPEKLLFTDYERTLALLARPDRDVPIGRCGGMQNPDAVFSWIGNNRAKGVSAEPAITFHANPVWSLEHWERSNDECRQLLVAAAGTWLGSARIIECELKRWRFATPKNVWPDECFTAGPSLTPAAPGPLALAGDAFAGPKVEGAIRSGLAAARFVEAELSAN